jgi:hypothetical protein
MQVTVNVPDKLAEDARARGMSVEVYVEQVLAQQAGERGTRAGKSICDAIDRIIELRKANKLAGLRTKDLIHEGHKY